MRCSLLSAAMLLAGGAAVAAQAPIYNVGRPPTARELAAAGRPMNPDGSELPPGSGTAAQGARIFQLRGCAGCHGPTGTEGPAPNLAAPSSSPFSVARTHVVDWPFAPLIWSWINLAMPLNQQGFLTTDEVYSLTAYVLSRNGIIQEDDVMDAKSLAKVQMPNRGAYTPPVEWKPGLKRPFPAPSGR